MENKYQKKNRESKKSTVFLGGMIALAILILVGSSYAILQLTLSGKKKVEITAGTLAIDYKEGNAVTLENAYPMSDKRGMETTPYEFTIENTGNIKAKYDIVLEDEKNKNSLSYKYIKYSIKKDDGEWSSPSLLSTLGGLVLEKGVEIDPGVKSHYSLRLWMDVNAGNDAQGKEYRAKIVVNAVQDKADTSDMSPPIVRLNGDLSVNIEEGSSYTDSGVESVSDDKEELDISRVTTSYEYYDGESTKEVESIDTNKVGVYYIYYKISDSSENEGMAIRSVNIYKRDTEPVVIELNGESLVAIEKGNSYEELGASARKGEEDLSSRIVTVGEVNSKRVGTYPVKYLITDQSGNTASIVRVVNVLTVGTVTEEVVLDVSTHSSESIELTGENLGEITYKSSDESIATIDKNGVVTGVKPGEVIIHITTSHGIKKSVRVRVQKTVEVVYVKQGTGVNSIGKEKDSCVITSGDSCTVSAPGITVGSGYTAVGWNTSNSATSGTAANENISLSNNATYYAISYKNAITYSVNFNANGNSVAATSKSCTIPAAYNNNTQGTSCSVTTPIITAPSATPTVIGYNQSAGTHTSQVGSNASLTLTSSNNGTTYYAQTTKASISYTVYFNANGNTVAASSKSCSIAATYNGTAQGSSCSVTTPVISAPSATPTVIGYNLASGTHTSQVGSNASLTVNSSNNGKTYYAQTAKAAVTRSVTYSKGSGVSSIGKSSDSCSIGATYNGTSQGSSCNVSLPSITSSAGYNTGFWSTSSSASSGSGAGTSVSLSGNATYYARALDTTKPVWSLVSTSPSSGSSSSITITFKGTDTSGSVTSTLAVGNITVKAGSTTVSPSTKTLSAASNVTNGKQYTLTLGGFNASGVVSITIAASTLKDDSNNTNDITTLTTDVTSVQALLSDVLISKANSASYTDGASAAQLQQPFTVTHAKGKQQENWTDTQLTAYRYMGPSPNNYISFNGETWRIIGVFTAQSVWGAKEKRVKIIRKDALSDGVLYSWDNSKSNDWSTSALQKVLNSGPYYNRTSGTCPHITGDVSCNFSSTGLTSTAKKMLGTSVYWYKGLLTLSRYTPAYIHQYERGDNASNKNYWTGFVGLMYPSDFGYAAGTKNCILNVNLFDFSSKEDSNLCSSTSKNWLSNYGYLSGTHTLSEAGTTKAHTIDIWNASQPSKGVVETIRRIYPSVYLSSSIKYSGGDGSSSNPYTISL